MTRYFEAGPEHAVETARDMDPERRLPPGQGIRPGLMRLHLSVYEPNDECQPHPSLPTLGELLAKNVDTTTGLLRYEMEGVPLAMDPAPLTELPAEYLDYRVSPGCSFVTHEALERAKSLGRT